MIFVTVGNHSQPFDRLIRWIDEIAQTDRVEERFFVQKGHSTYEPRFCESVDFLDMDGFERCVAQSKALICHAGEGSIITALQYGKTPIVVPRLRRFGEHRNDHQLEIATEFSRRGLVHLAVSKEEVISHLLLTSRLQSQPEVRYERSNQRLIDLVSGYLEALSARK